MNPKSETFNLCGVFGDPSGRTFAEICRNYELPPFVKEAALSEDYAVYTNEIFGDPAERRYPLNNRANTWMSRRFFEQDKGNLVHEKAAAVKDRIDKAVKFWKLEPDTKIHADPEEYHTIAAIHGPSTIFETKIASCGHYKEAAEYLYTHKDKMTYDMRRSFARGLHVTPDQFKTDLDSDVSEYIEKAAGFGMNTKPAIQEASLARVTYIHTKHPDYSERLVKMAKEVNDMDCTPSTLNKVAGMLDLVDRAVEMHRYYDKGLTTPEESIFSITEKKAASFIKEAVKLTTGDMVSKFDLLQKKAAVDKFFDSYIGEIPYSSDDEMIAVVESLPRNDAKVLVQAIEGGPTMRG